MVEESEERLSEEQIEELIQMVAEVLPGDPEQENAAPADAEVDEAVEQSWRSERPDTTRRWRTGAEAKMTTELHWSRYPAPFELSNMLTDGIHNDDHIITSMPFEMTH